MRTFRISGRDKDSLTDFLRDLVQTPSPSTKEGAISERIMTEMTLLGYQDVRRDRIGNVVGRIGPGEGPILMLNGHMDTVQVSAPEAWTCPPYGAEIKKGHIYGLGACDMKSGLAAMIYGASMLKDIASSLRGDVVVACVVQEEPSEGLGSRVLIEDEGVRPEWVVLAEPSNLGVIRGHRGRLEMRLVTHGRSAHAAAPRLGENAVYTAAHIAFSLELLADQLADDDFLGAGTLAVTAISSRSCSRNAVPDRCEMTIDRRLTLGENETKAISEIQRIIAREGANAEIEIPEYVTTSYTGYACRTREYYPAWVMPEDHPLIAAMAQAARSKLKRRPTITRWDFSTEGVYTAGIAHIPTVGFGPGDPALSHAADEHVRLDDVYTAAEVYAQLARALLGEQ